MEIGKKLKSARLKAELTQESVADKIQVSRQTISNWENARSYPDIVSIVHLSNLYNISLDELLKEDRNMLEHLEESTNVVKSNKKLIAAITINIVLLLILILSYSVVPENIIFLTFVFVLAIMSFSILLYQIIKKI
ncbi:MAG TPA: helix-turn-helix domain-containing protein [Firmicutes bacterium]|nr:helix-turn-helix transcriptional regulator [Bacillales bacterium]HJA41000.1 helix-turn-helix domain-containing protein [Bacillota bacterium]